MRHHKSNFVGSFSRTWQASRLSTVALLLSSLFLAACGGGSDDYSSTDNAADGAPSLSAVTIASGDKSTVTVGDVVTVTISASEAISAPTVTIGGSAATSVDGSGDSWTASRAMTADDTAGDISVSVAYEDISGDAGVPASATTDSSALMFEILLQTGFAIDGPFLNAKVFGDYNENGVHDAGEPSDITDVNGAYSLIDTASAPAAYTIVVEMTADTVDAISGESYADTGVVLKGSSAGSVVTPLTTILEAAKVSNPDYTAGELSLAMGLPVGVDIATYNPFAADADATTAHAVETVFQQVMTATLLVAEAMQGVGAIAGVELSAAQASAAALTALTNMVVASSVEVDLADSAQVATLQTFAKTELAAQSIEVSDAVADFILDKASATVTTVAAAFDTLTADDFTAGNTSAVSKVKQEAAAELAAMAAAAVTYLADNAGVADLSAFDTSATLTLDTSAGVDAAVVDNGGDTDSGPALAIEVTEAFNGTTIAEGSVYTFPASAESYAGFANMNTAIYPITLEEDSVITFTGSVPSGVSADVRFRFEANPYPATEPSFDTAVVTVSGSESATYSIAVPSQGANTFNSLIMYLNTRDVGVVVTNITLSAPGGDTGGTDPEPATGITITEAFNGTTIAEGSVYTFPASAESYAGFANMNTAIYPITVAEDSVITFTGSVPSGASAGVRFRFEANPYPATEPSFDTVEVTVDGADSATYSIAVPAQGANTFSSLIMYLNTRDVGVVVTDITLTAAGGDTGGGDTGGGDTGGGDIGSAPTPTADAAGVLSIFSDAYTDLEGTNFNPFWDQAGSVSTDNGVLTYSNLNYQGTNLGSTDGDVTRDVSGYESLHVDFYSADAQTLKFFLIGASGEVGYDLPVQANTWVSVDIPLTTFTAADLTQVKQFKVDANPNSGVTVLFDNLYFYGVGTTPVEKNVTFSVDMTGVDLGGEVPTLQGTFNNWCGACSPMVDSDGDNIWTLTVPLFDGSYQYKYALGAWVSDETVPASCDNTIGANRAVTVSADVTLAIDVYSGCPGDNDGSGDNGSGDIGSAPTPSADAASVLSIFSDAYTDLEGTNFNPGWGQSGTVATDGGVLTYSNLDYQGTEFSGAQDVSGYASVHVDFYSADAQTLKFFLVGAGETAYDLPVEANTWVSVDIPLTAFTGVDLTQVIQFKVDANPNSGVTVLFDNLYFHSGTSGSGGDTDTEGDSESDTGSINFDDSLTTYVFADIGPDANPGSNSAIVQDPDDATNSVVMSTRVGNTTTYNGLWFTESEDGGSIDTYEFESGDTVVSMRVRSPAAGKTVLLKFEVDDNAAISTVATAQTTVANQWETLSFDFAADVDFDVSYGKVVVIYDFEGSVDQADQIFYFDDLTYVSSTDSDTGSTDSDTGSTDSDTGSSATAPTPTVDAASVLSIFSDAYTDLEGTNFNPDWGQTGTVATDGGVLTYSNLNYQGTEFSGAQDVSGYESVHVDFYSADAQTLKFFLVGAGETAYDLPVAANTWVSVDIPLTAFTGVDLTQVIQFKVDANPNSGVTVLFDNLYFHSADVTETGTDTGSDTGTVAAGELITNGTFETGDLSGWTVDATSAGTLAVVNTVNNGGDYSLNLSVMEIQDAVIKAAGLAAGELTMGQSVTVSFDVKGEISDGGVIFAQFYYEGAAGVSNGNGALGNGLAPLAVSNSWSTFSYDETLDSDVSAGVTLQLKASCGAVAGCAINAYIDNVSVIVN